MRALVKAGLGLVAISTVSCGLAQHRTGETSSRVAAAHIATAPAFTDRGDVIKTCLSAWDHHPFGSQKDSPDRTLPVSVVIFGQGYAVDDQEYTSQPSLTLIPAAVNVLGNVDYNLLNPNAWYCLVAAVNIGGRMRLFLKDGAHLANDKLDVVVGGRSDAPGGVNVGIGANTDVIIVH